MGLPPEDDALLAIYQSYPLEVWGFECHYQATEQISFDAAHAVLLRFGCGLFTAWFSEDMQKFINSFYSCGVYILLQMFKYLAVITTAASLQPIRKQYFQNFCNSHKEKEE